MPMPHSLVSLCSGMDGVKHAPRPIRHRGYTATELVVVICILLAIFTALVTTWVTLLTRSVTPEYQRFMEEQIKFSTTNPKYTPPHFDGVVYEPGVVWRTLASAPVYFVAGFLPLVVCIGVWCIKAWRKRQDRRRAATT